jgi:hypothetical protein
MASVIEVEVQGTSHTKMSERAIRVAERALRILRAGLRADHWVADRQLRFRLGTNVWFDDGPSGWKAAPGQGWELALDDELVDLAAGQPIASLPIASETDVERRADLALRWFERSQLAEDVDMELLYLFFALESILGDKSEGLKAPGLAIRRAMLGLLTTGHFAHPNRINFLYDQVRSAAVHGEDAPAVEREEVDRFSWDTRVAINEFLEFASARGLQKRASVRRALDGDERRNEIVSSLVAESPKLWARYSTKIGDG